MAYYSKTWNGIKIFLIGIIVLFISIAGWVGWFSVSFGKSAKEVQSSIHALQQAQSSDLAVFEAHISGIKTNVASMRRDLSYLQMLSYVPFVGGEYHEADAALYSAEIIIEAGEALLSVFRTAGIDTKHVMIAMQDDKVAEAVVEAFQEQRKHMTELAARAEQHINEQQERQGSMISDTEVVYKRIHHLTESVVPLLYVAAWFDTEHLHMLGFSKPRRYLVVFQNAHELRTGGGLISMFGILDIENGDIVNLDVAHVSSLRPEGRLEDYPPAPDPLKRFVADYLYFHNANWDADPGVWTENVFRLWHQGQPDKPVDGVIVAGTPLLEDIVDVVGPVYLENVPVPLTGENVVEETDWVSIDAHEQEDSRGSERVVLQYLVNELRKKLDHASLDQLFSLVNVTANRNTARDFFVYLPEERASEYLGVLSSRAMLPDTSGDELHILGTNLGSAKGDLYMRRSVHVLVDASLPSSAFAKTDITFDYRLAKPDARTWPYNAHIRLLVPYGAGIPVFSNTQGEASAEIESGRASYGSYLFINFGEVQTVTATYDLAPKVQEQLERGKYSLMLRKQGGLEPEYTVSIRLPKGWEDINTDVTRGRVEVEYDDGQLIAHWEGTLTRDVKIVLEKR